MASTIPSPLCKSRDRTRSSSPSLTLDGSSNLVKRRKTSSPFQDFAVDDISALLTPSRLDQAIKSPQPQSRTNGSVELDHDNDDQEALTQQSILEELHQIHQEATQPSILEELHQEAIQTSILDELHQETTQPSSTDLDLQHDDDGNDPNPNPTWHSSSPSPCFSRIPEVSTTNQSLTTQEPKDDVLQSSITTLPISTKSTGSPLQDVEDDLDYALLFDGLDADDFDDIELSPVANKASRIDFKPQTNWSHTSSLIALSQNLQYPPSSESLGVTCSSTNVPPSQINSHGQTSPSGQKMAQLEAISSFHAATKSPVAPSSDEARPLPASQSDSSQSNPAKDGCSDQVPPKNAFMGFVSGHGKALIPSEVALSRAKRIFEEIESASQPPTHASLQLLVPTLKKPFQEHNLAATGPSIPTLSPANPTDIKTMRTPLAAVQPCSIASLKATSKNNQSGSANKTASMHLSQASTSSANLSNISTFGPPSATRDPFTALTPQRPLSRFSPNKSQVKQERESLPLLQTPTALKRVSLGTTPRSQRLGSSARKGIPKFMTPFKSGKKPELTSFMPPSPTQNSPVSSQKLGQTFYPPVLSRANNMSQLKGKHANRLEANAESVFNLTPLYKRKSLAEYGIRPESVTPLQAIAKGVPDEVLVILNDPSCAARYAFDGPNQELRGAEQAFHHIQVLGCQFIDISWVKNHWDLILWKMASLSRHCPHEALWRWSWDQVIRQMLYRYEREINLAQRSCIKRIQEHDSPSELPMVLFIASILNDEADDFDDLGGETGGQRRSIMLELSDGWYRIRASLDATLSQTVLRGRIKVGQKLAIMGAKLDSGGDGTDVLSALFTSTLSLSGNGVSLARWDTRLGFTREPFFASLRSLTPNGGTIPAMDIVITRVFPIAFMDSDESSSSTPQVARGEAEEGEVNQEWTKRFEEAKYQIEARFEERDRKLEQLITALCPAAQGSSVPEEDRDLEDEATMLLESLLDYSDPIKALDTLVTGPKKASLMTLIHKLAMDFANKETESMRSELEGQLLKVCPPRKVREFRVIKFRDARLPPPPDPTSMDIKTSTNRKNPYARSVQLTVWEPSCIGQTLGEGMRFIVTHLVPISKSAWRSPDEEADVFLATRRNTKWKLVG